MTADLFDALVVMTATGSLAILGVLAARTALRRWFGAQVAYAVWTVVPLVALVMLLPAPRQPVATVLHIAAVAGVHGTAAVMPTATDWRPAIVLLWLLGVFATAVAFALQQRRYLRSLGRLQALDTDGASRVLRAGASDGGPALVGAWRPRIVLPGDFEVRYAAHERELILAHERIHLARGDARINALVAALRCLDWFNPLIHFAAARFRIDQELACDAAVIACFPEARRPYADAMLKTQLAGQARQELRLPVGCRWSSRHPLKERIAMLKQPLPTRTRRAAGIALVVLAGLCSAYVAWAAQSPRPAAVAAEPGTQIDAQLKLSIDGADAKSVHLIHPVGEPFALKSDEGAWDAEFIARPVAGGAIELASTIRRGGNVVGKPVIVAEPGQPAAVEVGEPGRTHFRLEATLALLGSGAPRAQTVDSDLGPGYARLSAPAYSPAALAEGIEGMVVVAAHIDAKGAVTSARIDRVEPPAAAALGDAAIEAVKRWTFTPAMRDGTPVAGTALIPLHFAKNASGASVASMALPAGALDVIDVVGEPDGK